MHAYGHTVSQRTSSIFNHFIQLLTSRSTFNVNFVIGKTDVVEPTSALTWMRKLTGKFKIKNIYTCCTVACVSQCVYVYRMSVAVSHDSLIWPNAARERVTSPRQRLPQSDVMSIKNAVLSTATDVTTSDDGESAQVTFRGIPFGLYDRKGAAWCNNMACIVVSKFQQRWLGGGEPTSGVLPKALYTVTSNMNVPDIIM